MERTPQSLVGCGTPPAFYRVVMRVLRALCFLALTVRRVSDMRGACVECPAFAPLNAVLPSCGPILRGRHVSNVEPKSPWASVNVMRASSWSQLGAPWGLSMGPKEQLFSPSGAVLPLQTLLRLLMCVCVCVHLVVSLGMVVSRAAGFQRGLILFGLASRLTLRT